MKTAQIKVKKREKLGKSETRRLRNEDMVPCVMYGGEKNYHFYGHHNDFSKLVFTPEVHLVEIDMEGEIHKAIAQEVQFHPVTDRIIHIDYIQVFDDKPVVTSIPVELTGSSAGVRNGGKLRQRRRYLKVKGLIANMPEKLAIDITNLDIGQVIKIGDLSYPDLEILDPLRSMVVSVVSSRVAMKGMTVEEVEGEETEGAAAEDTVAEEGETGGNEGSTEEKE